MKEKNARMREAIEAYRSGEKSPGGTIKSICTLALEKKVSKSTLV